MSRPTDFAAFMGLTFFGTLGLIGGVPLLLVGYGAPGLVGVSCLVTGGVLTTFSGLCFYRVLQMYKRETKQDD